MVTGDMLKRFSPDQLLMVAVTLGAMFSLGCAGTWYEYFWGDGDGERALFFTTVAIFAVPLGVSAALSLQGDRRGRALLRFGAVLFVLMPPLFVRLWRMWESPEFRLYLWSRPPRTPKPDDRPTG